MLGNILEKLGLGFLTTPKDVSTIPSAKNMTNSPERDLNSEFAALTAPDIGRSYTPPEDFSQLSLEAKLDWITMRPDVWASIIARTSQDSWTRMVGLDVSLLAPDVGDMNDTI